MLIGKYDNYTKIVKCTTKAADSHSMYLLNGMGKLDPDKRILTPFAFGYVVTWK